MGLTRIKAEQISDIDYKQAVRAVTTSNVTLTGGAPATVDGVSLMANDRVLVNGQSSGAQNGLYIVQTLGTGSNGTWVRSNDGNQTGEIEAGMIVMVTEGTVYADTQWKLTTNDPIVIDTTPLTFVINILSSVGGANTQVQFNDGGTLSGSASFTFDKASNLVTVSGNVTANTGSFTTLSATSGLTVTGTANFTGNIIPTANVTYNLGNTTNRWNDLYLANSTIYLGNAQISANSTSIVLTNPQGGQMVMSGSATSISADTITVTGNVSGGNLTTSGTVSGGNVTTTGIVSASGNVSGGNVTTAGVVAATGNVSGGNVTTSGTVSGGNITASGTVSASTVSASGNVSGGNLLTSGTVSGGNITASGTVSASTVSAAGNVSGGNLSVTTGTVTLGNIVNANANGVGNIGSSTTYFNTVFAKATSAQYADLAELYQADQDYDPGTVVIFGGEYEITTTSISHDTRVAGVISTDPAFVMNTCSGGIPVALTGRVPCRVLGPVSKGDLLVTGSIIGTAEKLGNQWRPGCIIGKSLESISGDHVEVIEIVVGRF